MRSVIAIILCGQFISLVNSSQCDYLLNVTTASNRSLEEKIIKNGSCRCDFKPCFMKCCPEGRSDPSFAARNCFGGNDTFSLRSIVKGLPKNHLVLNGFPACPFYMPEDEEVWTVMNDGTLHLHMMYGETILQPGQFCLVYLKEKGDYRPLVCIEGEEESSTSEEFKPLHIIYPVGMIVSMPFLVATFLVYSLIPQLQNLHGRCLVSHIAALIISYLSLSIIMLIYDQHVTDLFCTLIGYIMQFAFLATFFWMNVMCFDIWWTFSSLKKPGGSVRERDLKKFLLYSVYAWGCPLLILTATLVADFTPLLSIHNKFKPQMGIEKCFFKTAASTWLYMYGPIAVLIVANLIMFGFTAKKIFLHTRETQVLKSEDSKRHDSKDRERFNLYLKLFIVMGVNWVAELVSWTFNSQSNIWYITDITNTLQGLIIFIIFVCKARVLRLLEAAVCPGRAEKRRNATNSSSRSRNTTTSVINGSARVVHSPETMKLKTPAADDSDSNM